MGKREDEEAEGRRRRREREDEQEAEEQRQQEAKKLGLAPRAAQQSGVGNKFIELMERAEPMIGQLDTLYNMYFSGAEKLPPVEKRKQLDQIMVALQSISKPTLGAQFKYNGIHFRYVTHADKWDKKLRDLENGKWKRPGGPVKRTA